jgi:rhodanese-related sulfurtransferase
MQDYIAFASQHLGLFALLMLVLIGLIISEIIGLSRSARKYTANQMILAVNREGAQLVDIREPNDYKTAHIAGAINIPLAQLTESTSRLDKTKPVVVICATGQRALTAVTTLQQQGYPQVAILDGGMATWRREALPTVSN